MKNQRSVVTLTLMKMPPALSFYLNPLVKVRRLTSRFFSIVYCAIGFLLTSSISHAEVKLDHLQWRRDLMCEEGIKEFGEGSSQLREKIAIAKGGTCQLFLKNDGATEIGLKSLTLNGTPVRQVYEQNKISWWRLMPVAVGKGQYGSLMIRYKDLPAGKVQAVAEFSDGSKINFDIDPSQQSPDYRFESFGFAQDRSKLVIYFRKYGDAAGSSVKEISFPGFESGKVNWITESFTHQIAGAEVVFKEYPKVGSYLYFKSKSESGKVAAYLIRVNDGFVQLGLFDEPVIADIPKLAANNQNMLTAHRHWASEQLDLMKRLGIRAGTYSLDDSPTDAPVGSLAHPAYDTIYTIDEPDVWDYVYWENRPEKPALDQRAGFYGPTVVQDLDAIRKNSGSAIQAGVVLDNTITPWNWYEYGEIADVVTQDNYVFPQGLDFTYLRRAHQVVMDAAAPVPTIHAFECCWHEINNDDPRRYNRPKTASEYRRLLLVPIGAGAKGLTGWWNVTDVAEPYTTWGTFEFADQWAIQGKTFAELAQVAPLLTIGCPIDGAKSSDPETRVGTLLAGKDAVVMLPVNESIDYSTYFSLQRRKEKVSITSPNLPWFKPTKAVIFKGFDYQEIPLKTNADGTFTIEIKTLVDAEVIVVTSNSQLPERLKVDYQKSRGAISGFNTQLLMEKYEQDLQKGAVMAIRRDLRINRSEQLVESAPLEGGSPDNHPDFVNPRKESKNATGWFTAKESPERVGFSIPFEIKKGGKTLFVFQLQAKVSPIQWEVHSAKSLIKEAKITQEREYKNRWTYITVELPQGGAYELVGFQLPALNKKPPGPKYWPAGTDRPKPTEEQKWEPRTGYVSKWVYVLPGIDLQGLIGNEALDLGMLANAKLTPPSAMDRKQLKAMNKALEQYAMSSADYQLVTAEKEDGCALSANAGFWGGIKKNGSENAYDLPISEKAELSKGIKYPISIGKRLEGTLLIQGETEKVPISMILCEASTGKEVDPKRYSIFLKSIGANWSALKINVHSPGEYTVRLFHVGDGDEKRGSISRWAITSSEKSFWESVHQVMTYLRVECAKAKLIPLRFGKEIWE